MKQTPPQRRPPRPPRPPRGPRPPGAREPPPRPIGDKCNPLCPYFRCLKNALTVTQTYYRGRPVKVPMCTWIGDKCIGPSCRFASCAKHAMLPDGRCPFAIQAKSRTARRMKDFEEELREMEEEAKRMGEFEEYY